MLLHTASEIISLAKKLESESAGIYEGLSSYSEEYKKVLETYSRENRNNIKQIEMTYYGAISDAIEGTFAYNLESDIYNLAKDTERDGDYPDAPKRLVSVEKLILQFYTEAAAQSESLMTDLQRVFTLLARRRRKRIEELEKSLGDSSPGI